MTASRQPSLVAPRARRLGALLGALTLGILPPPADAAIEAALENAAVRLVVRDGRIVSLLDQTRSVKGYFLTKEGYTELLTPDIHASQARFFKTAAEPPHAPLAQYLFYAYVFSLFGWGRATLKNYSANPLPEVPA